MSAGAKLDPGAPRRVWVVDDDETSLLLAGEILAEHGFSVRTFNDSALALASVREEHPDILVLDVKMPGLNGFDLCALLRSEPATADIPVLMVTSLYDAESVARAYEVGATNFATKPIDWVVESHRLSYMLRSAELEQQYLQAQKMEAIGTLAGGIAHDFNNLLLAISCSAELLRESDQVAGENRELADTILSAASRGAWLARQLLTFARKGAPRGERRQLDLNTVVQDHAKLLGRVFPKSVAIETQLYADLCPVDGSADQLSQVLMNLATNAMHAMPHGGVLRLETRMAELTAEDGQHLPGSVPGRHAVLVVSDTGHGMDPQTMRRIFEPFFTTKKVGEGTGLGLAVVYGILKDHGAQITCASEVGAGTTFTVYLPAGQVALGAETSRGEARSDVRGGSETVLVVDDDQAVRTVLQAGLGKQGYSVLVATDGASALRLLERVGTVGLVIMDLGMPGMDGWECLTRLRAIDPAVRVLLISGYGGQDLAERARLEGAVGLLGKPFALADILGSVRSALDRRGPDPDLDHRRS